MTSNGNRLKHMENSMQLNNVVTYKLYYAYPAIFTISIVVFFTYSQLFYVQPVGLICCLVIVLLLFIWINFLLSKKLEFSITKDSLIITDKNKVTSIRLADITGFYFHDDVRFRESELAKKGTPSAINIYYGAGQIFEATEYTALFLPEKYDHEKNEMFKSFLADLLKALNFKLIKKDAFRSFSNNAAAWYAKA